MYNEFIAGKIDNSIDAAQTVIAYADDKYVDFNKATKIVAPDNERSTVLCHITTDNAEIETYEINLTGKEKITPAGKFLGDYRCVSELFIDGVIYLAAGGKSHIDIYNMNANEQKKLDIPREIFSEWKSRLTRTSYVNQCALLGNSLLAAHSNVGILKVDLDQLLVEDKLNLSKDHLLHKSESGLVRFAMQDDVIMVADGKSLYRYHENNGTSSNLDFDASAITLDGEDVYLGTMEGKIFKNGTRQFSKGNGFAVTKMLVKNNNVLYQVKDVLFRNKKSLTDEIVDFTIHKDLLFLLRKHELAIYDVKNKLIAEKVLSEKARCLHVNGGL
jgi:hypothetical protein